MTKKALKTHLTNGQPFSFYARFDFNKTIKQIAKEMGTKISMNITTVECGFAHFKVNPKGQA